MIAATVAQTGTQFLAEDLRSALDPVALARHVGIIADPWQQDALRSTDRRQLWNVARQTGKSTTAAILALHTAIYTPRSLVLLVSPSLRQSTELFRTVSQLYARSGSMPAGEVSTTRLELPNGSRVISLPGSESTIRGFAGASLLILDEASRIEDALYEAVVPFLAVTNGKLLALSTPWGRRGWWAEAWFGPHAWRRVEVPVTMYPRISPEWIAEQRETMGMTWFDQEMMCRFFDTESSAFRSSDIERAQKGVEQWQV